VPATSEIYASQPGEPLVHVPEPDPCRTAHAGALLGDRLRVTLAAVTYIDRVAISWAAPSIRLELGLTAVQMGWVFAAFNWAYAMFEIPGGYLGDWIGPRKVLMRIVLWWSTFTAATGWAWSFPSLLGTRFLFGAGEAGCFPNVAKVFTPGCRTGSVCGRRASCG